MSKPSLSHLSDAELLRRFAALQALENVISTELYEHFAEADARGIADMVLPQPPLTTDPPAA